MDAISYSFMVNFYVFFTFFHPRRVRFFLQPERAFASLS
jgi:hypothetical protein